MSHGLPQMPAAGTDLCSVCLDDARGVNAFFELAVA
jgi:hypothetical protein